MTTTVSVKSIVYPKSTVKNGTGKVRFTDGIDGMWWMESGRIRFYSSQVSGDVENYQDTLKEFVKKSNW